MEKNIKILLPSKKYFKAEEQDLDIRIGLEESETLLREDDKNIILDVSTLFDNERNASKNYKVFGKLKMIFRNMYSGNTNYIYLKDRLHLIGDGSNYNYTGFIPYNEFAFLRNDVYRELYQSNTGNTLGYYTPITGFTGSTQHTTITPITAPYQNWNLYLSYVYGQDINYPMNYTLPSSINYTFTAKNGIPFRVEDNGSYISLTSPVEHNMKTGEYIIISGGTLTGTTSTRIFNIDSVGNEIYRSEKYTVNILKNEFTSGTTLSSVVLGKRCLDVTNISGTTSQYYVHKHKTLTNVSDYIMDKVGFETPIWEDEKKLLYKNYSNVYDYLVEKNRMESVLFDFKENFILSGLTNNLGYTPTDIYVTILLRNGNGYFDYPPKVGFKFNFHNTWIDKQFSGTTANETGMSGYTNFSRTDVNGTHTFKSGTTLSNGTILTGAFIEYNDTEMKETVISESFHKFISPKAIFNHNQDDPTYYSGVTSGNTVGLYYQPHYRVKLRQLSPYVESATTNDIYNLPENTKYFSNEKLWKWRDIYDHGFIDPDGYGTNYPFTNNTHYVNIDINFYLRNEREYTNKTDGLTYFENSTNNINC